MKVLILTQYHVGMKLVLNTSTELICEKGQSSRALLIAISKNHDDFGHHPAPMGNLKIRR
jgi:hypothetical protein